MTSTDVLTPASIWVPYLEADVADRAVTAPAGAKAVRAPALAFGRDVLPTPALDTAGLIRRVRRITDLSQRDLARHIGVSPATIARAESSSDGRVTARVLQRILALADMRLAVLDGDGDEVAAFPPDTATDNGGRHAPAHLDPYVAGPFGPAHFPLGHTERKVPRICWHHRPKRAALLDADPQRLRPVDPMTDAHVDDLWEVERVRRELRWRARCASPHRLPCAGPVAGHARESTPVPAPRPGPDIGSGHMVRDAPGREPPTPRLPLDSE